MAIFTGGKPIPPDGAGNPGQVFPANATDSAWQRSEPLITPEQLVARFLFGVDLRAPFPDASGKRPKMGNEQLKEIIEEAVSTAEEETKLVIMPTKFSEKYEFDRAEYNSFGYFKLRHRPCGMITDLTVCPSNNDDVFRVPLDWVETSYLAWGQINIIPLTLALVAGGTGIANTQAGGGAVFLSVLGQRPWVPAFWKIEGIYGFKDGMLPRPVNRLIGYIAAMDVISQLAPMPRAIGASLSADGLSQSTSTEGSKRYAQRMAEMKEERDKLVKKLRRRYGMGFGSGNV